MKGTLKVFLNIELKDKTYIESLVDYVFDTIKNQLEIDSSDFIEDFELKVDEM